MARNCPRRRPDPSVSACAFPVASAGGYRLEGSISGVPTSFLLDTGAAMTLIHKDTWEKVAAGQEITSSSSLKLVGADGSPLSVYGKARVNLEVDGEKMAIDAAIVSPLTSEAILGLDFLKEHKALIDIPQKQLYLGDKKRAPPLRESAPVAITTVAYLQDDHTTGLREAQLANVESKPLRRGREAEKNSHATRVTVPTPAEHLSCDPVGRRLHRPTSIKKVHYKPKGGDLVWLRSPVMPCEQSRELHRPWTGQYRVLKKLSEATYRIQHVRDSRQRHVVHFDRLKLCPPDMRVSERRQGMLRQIKDPQPRPLSHLSKTWN